MSRTFGILLLGLSLWFAADGLSSSRFPDAPGPPSAPGSSAAAGDSSASPAAVPEPWIIEGDSLWGTREMGSEILSPRIRHGLLQITALHGSLDRERNVLVLRDDVRIVDTTRVVTADQGVYRRRERVLELEGNVRGTGPEGSFQAGELTLDRSVGKLVLRREPQVADSARIIWADRIVYQSDSGEGEAEGDVRVLMRADSTWVHGDLARYDRRTGETIMTGTPWLYRPGEQAEGDLTVRADTLRMNELARKGAALGNVRIERGQVRATSEHAVFELVRNRTLLYGNPVAIDPDGEIRADTLSIRVQPGRPDALHAYGNVRTVYRPRERPGEVNAVLGDTLRASIEANVVTDLQMQGHAVSLFLPNLPDVRTGTGRNLSRARLIRVYLDRGEANRVDLIGEASGTYLYPGEASLRKLRSPAFLDSILPGGRVRGPSAVPPAVPRQEPVVPGPPVPGTVGPEAPGTEPERTEPPGQKSPGPETTGPPAPGAPPPGAGTLSHDAAASEEARAVPDSLWEGGLVDFFESTRSLDLPDSLRRPLDRLFDQTVDYEGDTIRFHVREDRISIRGQGVLSYQDSELHSEEIDYYSDQDLVTATGEPSLKDADSEVVGSRMTYRTDEHEGMVYQGKTEFEGGYYYGEEIKKLPDDELLVKNGDYTTCDLDSPHYHFHSEKMKLVLKDKVLARPVILEIGHIPVFAIPYYFFPIRKGRHSGILLPDVEFGFNKNRGRFVRNLGYYWAISDYMDARAWFDYFDQGPQFRFNGIYRYKIRYLLDGSFQGSYVNEKSPGGGKTLRWNFQGSHEQQLGETSRLTLRADFTSDKTFIEDYDFAAGVDQRLNRQLKSSVNYRKNWSRASLTATAARTEYLDQTTSSGIKRSDLLPSVDFNVNSFALGTAPDSRGQGGRLAFFSSTYLSNSYAFRAVSTQRFDGNNESAQAAQGNWSLSDTRRLGPYLRLTPSVRGNAAWFDEDNEGKRNQVGASWSASISAANTLYGTLSSGIGPLAGLRHVIEPSVSYSYRPEIRSLTYTDSLGNRVSRFPSVGGIGLSSSKSSAMSFRLDQRIHAKWRKGDEVIKNENLLTWSASSSYDFLAKSPRKPLSDINNSFRFRPFQTFETAASFTVDPYTWTRQNYSLTTNLRLSSGMFGGKGGGSAGANRIEYGELGEANLQGTNIGNRESEQTTAVAIPWDLSLSHQYSGSRNSTFVTNSVNAQLRFSPSSNWRVSGGGYYDLVKKQFISHSFSLYRDLHCWEFRFEYRSTGSYSFRIDIKDIPEVKYESER
jgi:lipopolysaccharide assembly outer membrane protein LptD (OstA)